MTFSDSTFLSHHSIFRYFRSSHLHFSQLNPCVFVWLFLSPCSPIPPSIPVIPLFPSSIPVFPLCPLQIESSPASAFNSAHPPFRLQFLSSPFSPSIPVFPLSPFNSAHPPLPPSIPLIPLFAFNSAHPPLPPSIPVFPLFALQIESFPASAPLNRVTSRFSPVRPRTHFESFPLSVLFPSIRVILLPPFASSRVVHPFPAPSINSS